MNSTATCLPNWWRLALIALATLLLCSCRTPAGSNPSDVLPAAAGDAIAANTANRVPPQLYLGRTCLPPGSMIPVPYGAPCPCVSHGAEQLPPCDEYLCDGGDSGLPILPGRNGEVRGLEMENAVAQYETLDGQHVVQPTNRVCVYAPRFGAVRQVVAAESNEQLNRLAGVHLPVKALAPQSRQPALSDKQNVQVRPEISAQPPVLVATRQWGAAVSTALGPRGFQNIYQAYENLAIIRRGVMVQKESVWLARGANAAVAWNSTQAVQVMLDRKLAIEQNSAQKSQEIFTIGQPPGQPQLRVVKVASTPFAEPGEEISFTIRFDNVGDQVLGNVVILDSLTTRLEYIAGSAQCSREAQFTTTPNEGDSVVIRCELADPLKAGTGGVLRFRCRVR
jgi:uncharacterized repeat protein (TIGR01451 family)